MRAHYQAPVQDSTGALLPGTVVSVYLNGTMTLDTEPVYADGSSNTQLGNPFVTASGVIDFYLASPERVDLGIQPPGEAQVVMPDIDVNESEASSVTLTFPGGGTSSTQVGASANAAGNNASAFGVSAIASGTSDTALGEASTASGGSSLAVGQGATAQGFQSTVVGQGASAGSSAAAGTAVGQAAQASGPNGTAVGSGASAAGSAATAVGEGASAGYPASSAIGTGASAGAAHQIAVGTAAETVIVPGVAQLAVALQIGAGASAATIATSGTITTAGKVYAPVTNSGAVGSVILQAGTLDGQICLVANFGTGSVNFATTGSHINDGVHAVLPPGGSILFAWNAAQALWYRASSPVEQYITLTSSYTLASSTSAQALFNVPASGAFTAPAGAVYFFECAFDLTTLSSSSSGFGFGFGGTATYSGVRFQAIAAKATRATPAAPQNTVMTSTTTPTPISIVTASTTTEGYGFVRGIIRVNAAGTVIPQIQQITASAAGVVQPGAYFKLTPVSSLTAIGNWS